MSIIPFRYNLDSSSIADEVELYFARVPGLAVFDERVRAAELRIISAIASYADKYGCAYPSVGTMAKRLRVSRQAIQRQIKLAVKHGYVQIEVRKTETGGSRSNLYRINLLAPSGARNRGGGSSNEGGGNTPSGSAIDSPRGDWCDF